MGSFNRTGPVKIPLKQRINQISDDFNDILSNDDGGATVQDDIAVVENEKPNNFGNRGSGQRAGVSSISKNS